MLNIPPPRGLTGASDIVSFSEMVLPSIFACRIRDSTPSPCRVVGDRAVYDRQTHFTGTGNIARIEDAPASAEERRVLEYAAVHQREDPPVPDAPAVAARVVPTRHPVRDVEVAEFCCYVDLDQEDWVTIAAAQGEISLSVKNHVLFYEQSAGGDHGSGSITLKCVWTTTGLDSR